MNSMIERATMGRVASARIPPDEDLVGAIEKLCSVQGFRHAFVRAASGRLSDACLSMACGRRVEVRGPSVEVVSLAGEVQATSDGSVRASLTGVVADTRGNVHGGPFVAGQNPIDANFEVTLEEWLPVAASV